MHEEGHGNASVETSRRGSVFPGLKSALGVPYGVDLTVLKRALCRSCAFDPRLLSALKHTRAHRQTHILRIHTITHTQHSHTQIARLSSTRLLSFFRASNHDLLRCSYDNSNWLAFFASVLWISTAEFAGIHARSEEEWPEQYKYHYPKIFDGSAGPCKVKGQLPCMQQREASCDCVRRFFPAIVSRVLYTKHIVWPRGASLRVKSAREHERFDFL